MQDQNTNYTQPVEKKTLPASATPKALQAGIPTFVGIAIIIVVAVLLFGAVFAWQYFLMSQKDGQSQNLIACTEEAKICSDGSAVGRTGPNCEFAPCPDLTAGWKTYTNNEYGFEIKYPNNAIIDSSNQEPFELGQIKFSFKLPSLVSLTTFNLDKNEFESSGLKRVYFNIGVDSSKSDLSICQTEIPNWEATSQNQKTVVNINETTFYKYRFVDSAMGGQRRDSHVYIGVKNQNCFLIHGAIDYSDLRGFTDNPVFLTDADFNKITDYFDKISSTFKFINSTVQSSITVISPNGGETLKVGQNINITWDSKGLLDTDNIVIRINDSSVGASDEDSKTIAFVKGNLTSYNWAIPVGYKIGSKYKVSLSVVRNEPITADGSDNYFTITK